MGQGGGTSKGFAGLIHKGPFSLMVIWARRSKCPYSKCPALHWTAARVPWFCSLWQNSNRLDQVSLHDNLRVAFQRSKNNSFKFLQAPRTHTPQSSKVPFSTFHWSTQVTRPAQCQGVEKQTPLLDRSCEIPWTCFQSTISHTSSLH